MTERNEVERLKNDLSLCREGNAQAVELLIERASEIAALKANVDRADRYNADSMYERDGLRREVERLKEQVKMLAGMAEWRDRAQLAEHQRDELRREVERLTKEKTGRFNYVKSSHPHFYPFGDGECYFCRVLFENEQLAALKAEIKKAKP